MNSVSLKRYIIPLLICIHSLWSSVTVYNYDGYYNEIQTPNLIDKLLNLQDKHEFR